MCLQCWPNRSNYFPSTTLHVTTFKVNEKYQHCELLFFFYKISIFHILRESDPPSWGTSFLLIKLYIVSHFVLFYCTTRYIKPNSLQPEDDLPCWRDMKGRYHQRGLWRKCVVVHFPFLCTYASTVFSMGKPLFWTHAYLKQEFSSEMLQFVVQGGVGWGAAGSPAGTDAAVCLRWIVAVEWPHWLIKISE